MFIQNYHPRIDLARRINKSYSFIGKLRRGEKNPSLDTLYDLANVFNVSVPYLLREARINNAKNQTTDETKGDQIYSQASN